LGRLAKGHTHALLRRVGRHPPISGLLGLPSLDLGKLPSATAGGQLDGSRKARVSPVPASRGQSMDAPPVGEVSVREIDFRQVRLHAVATERILPHTLPVAHVNLRATLRAEPATDRVCGQ